MITAPSATVSEGTTGWYLSLKIIAYPPEYDIEVRVDAGGTSTNPAMAGVHYIAYTWSLKKSFEQTCLAL